MPGTKMKKTPKNRAEAEALLQSIQYHLRYSCGSEIAEASPGDLLRACSLAARERMIDGLLQTENRVRERQAKRLYYLSMEFLIGRSLGNNLQNLGILDLCDDALAALGSSLEEVMSEERDAALGNGGLGRLAACFLDSLATLGMPGYGFGINYEFGLFKQKILNGYQKEVPDQWLSEGSPWLIERTDQACLVPLYGRLESITDHEGRANDMWLDWELLIGVPHDMPVVGYGGKTVNYLRLYSAKSSDQFDIDIFNSGDYIKAVEHKIRSETVSKVLYPSDSVRSGKELRLIQEYFLVSCAIRDIMRNFLKENRPFSEFPARVAIQLNDTHPALAVAELMRSLVDEQGIDWQEAWSITTRTLAYTNHTLLPEALEKWPVSLFQKVLPRHLQIIYRINQQFLDQVAARWPGDVDRLRRMSIIEENPEKQVRMAYLSIVGSHSINGVAELHSQLLKNRLVPDFYELWPERFNNKTNGITQRRWLLRSNPLLAQLITSAIGEGWITRLHELRKLELLARNPDFQAEFRQVKKTNKEKLAQLIRNTLALKVDPDSLFDVQIKRIHEYKRQLLKILHIIHQYLQIENGILPEARRTFIFAGKAAPGYRAAKQIIKLINNVAKIINGDPRAREYMSVVFLPDYRVSLAEQIFPAADLSEQISTAGMEASGTGNMKFALNGALTIGTLDGANIEIRAEVGEDNIFIFGLKAEEIAAMKAAGSYRPEDYYRQHAHLAAVLESLRSDRFCPDEPGLFTWIYDSILREGDRYFLSADFPAYVETQLAVDSLFRRPSAWTEKAILNVARIGKFSSDRTVSEYAAEIWDIHPLV